MTPGGERYRRWSGERKRSLRQRHLSGGKLSIDYSGQTAPIVDRFTGEIRRAGVFVAVMGASNYSRRSHGRRTSGNYGANQ